MIRANELRLGNLIQHKYSGVIKADLNAISIVEIQNREDIEEIYSPIPLTEEWLLKMGFDYLNIDRYKFLKYKTKNFELLFTDNKVKVGIQGVANIEWFCECEFIHQLQNLFYSLTGEELTLNQIKS